MAQDISKKIIKVVVLGDGEVGKTSILLRFVKGSFQEERLSTVGGAFVAKSYTYKSIPFQFQVWDTAGQEKYHSLAPLYYRDAEVAILVYDVTKKKTFGSLKRWREELEINGPKGLTLAVVGNKIDLYDQEEVSTDEAGEYAKSQSAMFKLTSAKEDRGIKSLFDQICEDILNKNETTDTKKRPRSNTLSKENKSNCCY